MASASIPVLSTNVPYLTTVNYLLWAPAMEDYFRAKGMWYWIHADTPDQKYAEARDQAVGEIHHHISPELHSIAVSSSDPETILEVIQATYGTSSFTTRHNSLQAFLAVRQEASESVAAFIGATSNFAMSAAVPPAWCRAAKVE